MGKGGGRGGVHPWVKKFFWSTPEVKKYGGAASLGWRRGSAAENFLTLPCNSRSKNGEKWTLPRVKWVPPPSKIGADSLKMAKVPRELAPQVKNFPAAKGGRQIFDIAPWELTPQVTFFACPCMKWIYSTFVQNGNGKKTVHKRRIFNKKAFLNSIKDCLNKCSEHEAMAFI